MYFLLGPSGVWAVYIPWKSPSLRFVILSPLAGIAALHFHEFLRLDVQRFRQLSDRARLRPHHAVLQAPYRVAPDTGLLGKLLHSQHPLAPQVPQHRRV